MRWTETLHRRHQHAHCKRDLRIVYLIKQTGHKVQTALLFSTDLELDAETLVRYYKARFQIEFLFRDAKPFLGLNHCQARCSEALHFHFNASMTAIPHKMSHSPRRDAKQTPI